MLNPKELELYTMNKEDFLKKYIIDFIKNSPSSYRTVDEIDNEFTSNGFNIIKMFKEFMDIVGDEIKVAYVLEDFDGTGKIYDNPILLHKDNPGLEFNIIFVVKNSALEKKIISEEIFNKYVFILIVILIFLM